MCPSSQKAPAGAGETPFFAQFPAAVDSTLALMDGTMKWNFVLGDDSGHQIDVHSFVFDNAGNVVDGIIPPPH